RPGRASGSEPIGRGAWHGRAESGCRPAPPVGGRDGRPSRAGSGLEEERGATVRAGEGASCTGGTWAKPSRTGPAVRRAGGRGRRESTPTGSAHGRARGADR